MEQYPIKETANRRAWNDFKSAHDSFGYNYVVEGIGVATTTAVATILIAARSNWSDEGQIWTGLIAFIASLAGFAILSYGLIWVRTPIRQRNEARDAAELKATRLQVARRVFYSIAAEGQDLIAAYELDVVLEPTLERREEWFQKGCRALETILNPYVAGINRNRHMLNEGLEFGKWGPVMLSLAGDLAARAGQIDESDLSPEFHVEEWGGY